MKQYKIIQNWKDIFPKFKVQETSEWIYSLIIESFDKWNISSDTFSYWNKLVWAKSVQEVISYCENDIKDFMFNKISWDKCFIELNDENKVKEKFKELILEKFTDNITQDSDLWLEDIEDDWEYDNIENTSTSKEDEKEIEDIFLKASETIHKNILSWVSKTWYIENKQYWISIEHTYWFIYNVELQFWFYDMNNTVVFWKTSYTKWENTLIEEFWINWIFSYVRIKNLNNWKEVILNNKDFLFDLWKMKTKFFSKSTKSKRLEWGTVQIFHKNKYKDDTSNIQKIKNNLLNEYKKISS